MRAPRERRSDDRTSGWVEWQLKQAGGVLPKSASPSAIGLFEARGNAVPSVIPCGVAALTTIGRGGQLLLSMFDTTPERDHVPMSWSDRFGFGISLPCCASE